MVYIFLATGFEETEAVTVIDIIRRAGIEITVVSISDNIYVTGAHNITLKADKMFSETDFSLGRMLILPGGMPGSTNLNEHKPLKDLIVKYDKEGKYIAAICAAPMVFGELGLLENKKATCYPGFESHLKGAILCTDYAVEDGNIITGKGPAAEIGRASCRERVWQYV